MSSERSRSWAVTRGSSEVWGTFWSRSFCRIQIRVQRLLRGQEVVVVRGLQPQPHLGLLGQPGSGHREGADGEVRPVPQVLLPALLLVGLPRFDLAAERSQLLGKGTGSAETNTSMLSRRWGASPLPSTLKMVVFSEPTANVSPNDTGVSADPATSRRARRRAPLFPT